jgi:hypothetical protein
MFDLDQVIAECRAALAEGECPKLSGGQNVVFHWKRPPAIVHVARETDDDMSDESPLPIVPD